MEIKIKRKPEEIEKLLHAMCGSEEQFVTKEELDSILSSYAKWK